MLAKGTKIASRICSFFVTSSYLYVCDTRTQSKRHPFTYSIDRVGCETVLPLSLKHGVRVKKTNEVGSSAQAKPHQKRGRIRGARPC